MKTIIRFIFAVEPAIDCALVNYEDKDFTDLRSRFKDTFEDLYEGFGIFAENAAQITWVPVKFSEEDLQEITKMNITVPDHIPLYSGETLGVGDTVFVTEPNEQGISMEFVYRLSCHVYSGRIHEWWQEQRDQAANNNNNTEED